MANVWTVERPKIIAYAKQVGKEMTAANVSSIGNAQLKEPVTYPMNVNATTVLTAFSVTTLIYLRKSEKNQFISIFDASFPPLEKTWKKQINYSIATYMLLLYHVHVTNKVLHIQFIFKYTFQITECYGQMQSFGIY